MTKVNIKDRIKYMWDNYYCSDEKYPINKERKEYDDLEEYWKTTMINMINSENWDGLKKEFDANKNNPSPMMTVMGTIISPVIKEDDDINCFKNIIGYINFDKIPEDGKKRLDGHWKSAMHKVMVVHSLFVENCDFKYKLFPQNEIPDEWYETLCPDGNSTTWLDQGHEMMEKLYEIVGVEQPDLDAYIRLSGMLWILYNQQSVFEDITNDDYLQIIYTGAPGTGKTYGIEDYVKMACQIDPIDKNYISNRTGEKIKQYEFVQFHSSYDYSDFIEGLRPGCLPGSRDTTFVRMDGVFKKFCRNVAEYNKQKTGDKPPFYFIIDEINRADLGKVFGELMFAFEKSYRDKSFNTQYDGLPTYYSKKVAIKSSESEKYTYELTLITDDIFSDGFFVPSNVHIIGSMNDIDRSVETFDFALRRRFLWKEVKADDEAYVKSVLNGILRSNEEARSKVTELYEAINKLNKLVSGNDKNSDITGADFGLDESYMIGPAYFDKFDGTKKSLQVIWENRINPILREYTRVNKDKDAKDLFISRCKTALLEGFKN